MAVSTSLLGAARDFAFCGGDFPTPPAGPLWVTEHRPPPGAKSSGEEARQAGGWRSGRERAQERFLRERGRRARFRKADCIRCGARRLLCPTWRPLRLRASPRPAPPPRTPLRVFLPVPRRSSLEGWVPFTAPDPREWGWQGRTPGELWSPRE